MDIFKLRTFYQVAKLGSLTLASKQIGYSIPNVSRQLASLEETLNVKLFHRSKNKIHLTIQGEILFQKAAHILAEIEFAKGLLRQDEETPAGLLRVFTINILASVWITSYIKGFLEQYPHIKLAIFGENREADISSQEFDVGIGPYIPNSPDLIQTHLMTWSFGLYASKEYLEKYGTPHTLEDLDHHRLIGRSESTYLPHKIFNWFLMAGRENNPREPYIHINSVNGAINLVLEGVGIATLGHAIKEVRQNKLIRLLPNLELPSFDIFYIYPSKLKNSKCINCLQDYLLAELVKQKEHKI